MNEWKAKNVYLLPVVISNIISFGFQSDYFKENNTSDCTEGISSNVLYLQDLIYLFQPCLRSSFSFYQDVVMVLAAYRVKTHRVSLQEVLLPFLSVFILQVFPCLPSFHITEPPACQVCHWCSLIGTPSSPHTPETKVYER